MIKTKRNNYELCSVYYCKKMNYNIPYEFIAFLSIKLKNKKTIFAQYTLNQTSIINHPRVL